MRVARIFLNPDGGQWRDFALAEGQDARTVFTAVRTEGAFIHPLAVIYEKSIHNVVVVELPDNPQMPTFVLPDTAGKPN